MASNYYLVCQNCNLFIDLHKWSIVDELVLELQNVQKTKQENTAAGKSDLGPFVVVDSTKVLHELMRKEMEESISQDYIRKLIQALIPFVQKHFDHQLQLFNDVGTLPWYIGEENWFIWKEEIAAFNYNATFLPKNLIDDFGLKSWNDILQYYEENEHWFLHEQMKEQLDELELRYIKMLS